MSSNSIRAAAAVADQAYMLAYYNSTMTERRAITVAVQESLSGDHDASSNGNKRKASAYHAAVLEWHKKKKASRKEASTDPVYNATGKFCPICRDPDSFNNDSKVINCGNTEFHWLGKL